MIHVENLSARVGKFVLQDISFSLESGTYGVLMGATGCGKSTLLECLCGLRQTESGKIFLNHEEVTDRRPAERGIGYVPQDGALFPSMTVRKHLEFPLRIRNWSSNDIRHSTEHLAALLSIESLLDRRPVGLSGGEVQRVALGRAIAFRPTLLLLDEPLSALDEGTRERMCVLLESVQKQTKVTTLHVTHSQREAKRLADRLFLLRDGILTTQCNNEHANRSKASTILPG